MVNNSRRASRKSLNPPDRCSFHCGPCAPQRRFQGVRTARQAARKPLYGAYSATGQKLEAPVVGVSGLGGYYFGISSSPSL